VDVVKCFNTTGFNVMEDPKFGGVAADMFMAGSSSRAKATASQFARDAGFAECYDRGVFAVGVFIWGSASSTERIKRKL
jgi:predicted dinucleotide-binding enzyme